MAETPSASGVPPIEPMPAVAPPKAPPYPQPQPSAQASAAGYYAPAYYGQPPAPRGLSIASMVLGIVGVLFGLIYGLGLFPSIAAIITGHIARKRQPAGRGFSLAGLICGYVGLLGSLAGVALLVVVIVVIANAGGISKIGTDSTNLGFN